MIHREAWYQEITAKRVSDSFISEYRDIISRYDDLFSSLCDLESKLEAKEASLWDGLSKESKEEVGNPINYRAKLNAMQQWWATHRPKGKANYSLTLPKDRKQAAKMIESELEKMEKLVKYGEKQLEKMKDSLLPEDKVDTEDNPPVTQIFPDMG